MSSNEDHRDIRDGIAKLCSEFGSKYWQECDQGSNYPKDFVNA